jgi:hypothetical protein
MQIETPGGLFAKRKEAQPGALHDELARAETTARDAKRRAADARAGNGRTATQISDLSGRLTAVHAQLAGVPQRAVLARQAEAADKEINDLDRRAGESPAAVVPPPRPSRRPGAVTPATTCGGRVPLSAHRRHRRAVGVGGAVPLRR